MSECHLSSHFSSFSYITEDFHVYLAADLVLLSTENYKRLFY